MKSILVVFQSVRNSDIIIGNFISHTDKYPVRYSTLQKISEEIKRVNEFTNDVIILNVILLGKEE